MRSAVDRPPCSSEFPDSRPSIGPRIGAFVSPSDAEQRRFICIYKDDREDAAAPSQLSGQLPGGWVYQGVRQNLWHKIQFNLRDANLLPDARYLQLIRIEAQVDVQGQDKPAIVGEVLAMVVG